MESITLGDLQGMLIFLASFITSGGIITTLVIKIIKKMINNQVKPICESMKDEILKIQDDQFKIHDELKRNSLNTMKNTICNDMIPLSERITVGKEYIDQGGNGAVKILVHTLEEQYEKELKKGE